MRRFGDPRTKDVDAIDWIEMIPFEETRDYVKKVLSNIQMYRARLGEKTPVRLVSDLKR
jgi:soluble lytic murein transglycosylase